MPDGGWCVFLVPSLGGTGVVTGWRSHFMRRCWLGIKRVISPYDIWLIDIRWHDLRRGGYRLCPGSGGDAVLPSVFSWRRKRKSDLPSLAAAYYCGMLASWPDALIGGGWLRRRHRGWNRGSWRRLAADGCAEKSAAMAGWHSCRIRHMEDRPG